MLENVSRQLGVEELVRFEGAIPPAEIPARLGNADALVFPAEGEGFGLVAAEALMAGVPVIACRDGGGVLDIVPSEGAGRIVEPDPNAIASAIAAVTSDRSSRDEARRLGASWRLKLHPDTVAEACERWYQEASRGEP